MMTRWHKLCQRHQYNDRKQKALPAIRKTPTNYADCPYQLRRNGTESNHAHGIYQHAFACTPCVSRDDVHWRGVTRRADKRGEYHADSTGPVSFRLEREVGVDLLQELAGSCNLLL